MYCNNKYTDYVYTAKDTKLLKCPRCSSGHRDLDISTSSDAKHCKDCGDEMNDKDTTSRCERCWNDRFGQTY